MDNVTHTLAGLVLAEGAGLLRARRTGVAPTGRLRTAAALVGAVGANLPDLDVLWTTPARDPLTYLLHHRGHTHTVVVGALGAVALALGAWALLRARARRAAARRTHEARGLALADGDRGWLLALSLVAVASHLLLDWTNNYGVHPFWPLDARWSYGDAVFIVEPWLWAVVIPSLALLAHRTPTRVWLWLVLLGGLSLAWTVPLVPREAALAVSVGAVLVAALAWRLGAAGRVALAVVGWLAVEGTFAAATRAARAQFAPLGAADVVITPGPAHPLCATAIVVEREGAGDAAAYRVTTASVAPFPALSPVSRCAAPEPSGTLRMTPATDRPATGAIAWAATWRAPLAELRTLARTNCRAAAALRFIRVPYWTTLPDGARVLGDVRYDRGPGLDFADVRLDGLPCPGNVPPWTEPVRALLGG